MVLYSSCFLVSFSYTTCCLLYFLIIHSFPDPDCSCSFPVYFQYIFILYLSYSSTYLPGLDLGLVSAFCWSCEAFCTKTNVCWILHLHPVLRARADRDIFAVFPLATLCTLHINMPYQTYSKYAATICSNSDKSPIRTAEWQQANV